MFKALFSSQRTSSSAHPEDLKSFMENVIRGLVDDPDQVELSDAGIRDGVLQLELRVSKSDLGKVIGKKGRTASAMRTILSAAARRQNLNADLKIIE